MAAYTGRNFNLDDEKVKHFADCLIQMLDDYWLQVVLVPAPDPHFSGHKIRQVNNCNPRWYRDLYRKTWPELKRCHFIWALKKIRNEEVSFLSGRYEEIAFNLICDLIEKMVLGGMEEHEFWQVECF